MLSPVNEADKGERATRVIALTMAYNEGEMLGRWVDYYQTQLGPDSVMVLDHGSTDGAPQALTRVPVLPLPRRLPPHQGKNWFDPQRTRMVNWIAAGLLEYYDVVIYADTDEFLLAEPSKYGSLLDFIDDHDEPFIAGVGLNVLHDTENEPPLDPAAPVLAQRRLAMFVPSLCKPLIRRSPKPWSAAFHGARQWYRVSPDLYVVHLKFADREQHVDKHSARNALFNETGAGSHSWWRFSRGKIDRHLADFLSRDAIPLDDTTLDDERMVRRNPKGGWKVGSAGGPNQQTGPYLLPARWSSVL